MSENNILIAEFMGCKFQARNGDTINTNVYDTYAECQDYIDQHDRLGFTPVIVDNDGLGNYHVSYDSLIPVMQKIFMTATAMPKEYYNITHMYAIATIDEMYYAVIEYIKWHNSKIL